MSKARDSEAPATEEAETPTAGDAATGESAPPDAAGESPEEALRRLEEEVARLRDQRVRALADADNVRKRASRDLEDASRYAVTGFARDMVSVLENLIRAAENIEAYEGDDPMFKTLGEGVTLTLQELLAIFEKYHIRRVDPMGEKFDHNLHQAVAQVERGDVPPGTVVQVVQAGYTIHDRLLRPAMVAVSKQGGDAPKQVDTTA